MGSGRTTIFEFEPYGRSAEGGGPDGEFFASDSYDGDGTGGDFVVRINGGASGDTSAMKARLFVIRRFVVFTDETTPRAVDVAIENERAGQAIASVPIFAGSTVAGRTNSVLALPVPFIWRPAQHVNNIELFRVTTVNTNGEAVGVQVEGQYWELQKLRQEHVGPLIRW